MPWLSQTDACEALNLSQRTLSRRIKMGKLETRRRGYNVDVLVEDAADTPMAMLVESGRDLADSATAAVAQRQIDSHFMDSQLEAMDKQLAIFQKAQERADLAERRAEDRVKAVECRSVRWVRGAVGVIAVILIVAVSGGILGGMEFHRETLEHRDRVSELKAGHVDAVGRLEGEHRDSIARLEVEKVGEVTALETRLESTRAALTDARGQVEESDAAAREAVRGRDDANERMAALEVELEVARNRAWMDAASWIDTLTGVSEETGPKDSGGGEGVVSMAGSGNH